MKFQGDPRRRSIALLAAGVLLVFALLGALQWWNTSSISFLNPETSGETLVLPPSPCWYSCFCWCC
jgi:hypothetical protein